MANKTKISGEEKTISQKDPGKIALQPPVVAIVGRPNVGKSTLLNRIAGAPIAVVDDLPGTTRDRIFADVEWQGNAFSVVDTAGLELEPTTPLSKKVQEQVENAISEAEALILVVDAHDGVTPLDLEIANMLRCSNKPVVVAANKVDNQRHEALVPEFYRLGLGDPLGISSYHDRGISELLDAVVALLPLYSPEPLLEGAIKVAIVGRPNVGKSMLVNGLLGEERVVVNETPGTTRDAIDTKLEVDSQTFVIIDTAGIRRRGRITPGLERYSVLRAFKAISRSDVALLVLDATEPVTAQDAHIAGYIQQATKGVVILVNKWDLVSGIAMEQFTQGIRENLKFLPYAPLHYVSAKLGWGLDKVLPMAQEVYLNRQQQLPASLVSKVIEDALAAQPPPRVGKRSLKIFSAIQTGINPPTFVFKVNDVKLLHFSYRRYIENKLRHSGQYQGTPLRLIFKSRGQA